MVRNLCILHNNSEFELIFSVVLKNSSEIHSSLSDDNLESLLVAKKDTSSACFRQKFAESFLSICAYLFGKKKIIAST